MDPEAAGLRRELARVANGRGTRYPAELRERVVAWAIARRRAGASWRAIKAELGQVRHGSTVVHRSSAKPATRTRCCEGRSRARSGAAREYRITVGVSDRVAVTHRGGGSTARARMLLGTSRAVRVFAYPEAVDLRKGYGGLYGLGETGTRPRPAEWRSVLVLQSAASCMQGFGVGRDRPLHLSEASGARPLRIVVPRER
jgi:hypothetical protein